MKAASPKSLRLSAPVLVVATRKNKTQVNQQTGISRKCWPNVSDYPAAMVMQRYGRNKKVVPKLWWSKKS